MTDGPRSGPPAGPRITALLAGATGMVGALCLEHLLADEAFGDVVALTRRPLERTQARLRAVMCADFARVDELPPAAPATGSRVTALCALGTTIKQAGSQAAFRAVDHDAVLAFARWARRSGADTFVLCSSVGASTGSRFFYLRLKGEVEEALGAVGFPSLVIARPGLLLGARAQRRPMARLQGALTVAVSPLLAGSLRRYRAIAADAVAAAMVRAAKDAPAGRHVWEHADLA